MGLWHIWGFHRELPAARQVGRKMHRQAQDTRRRRLALPSHRLDQEPLSIRKKGRLWEARGPAVCPWWEAPEGQGWQQGVH